MSFENIVFLVDQGVATITFSRPKALNALNQALLAEFSQALDAVAADESVRVLVLTGAGEKAFVAGADISQMRSYKPYEALAFAELGHEVMDFLEDLAKPSIAAINGFALGGGQEIALACDVRFASKNAVFGQPEILLGVIPGWGGTQRLTRIIGLGRAKEIILSDLRINADRAYEIGLVNQVFPLDQLLPESMKFAMKLAGLPGFTLKMAKQSMNGGRDLPLESACRLERECFAQCFSTDDQKEGMTAFLEKKKPVFVGH